MTGMFHHAIARAVAEALIQDLRTGCERIEVAGSVRRGERLVKDLEIVAIPKLRRDLFGEIMPDEPTELDQVLEGLFRAHTVDLRAVDEKGTTRNGPKYKALRHCRTNLGVDLFIVRRPAQWGAIFAIRTGPADYSRKLVTKAQDRGLQCREGHLVRIDDGAVLNTPEEGDFIRACGLPLVPPQKRRA